MNGKKLQQRARRPTLAASQDPERMNRYLESTRLQFAAQAKAAETVFPENAGVMAGPIFRHQSY